MDDGLEGPAEFFGESALGVERPAQERRPGALQGDDRVGGEGGPLAAGQADRRYEQTGGADRLGVGWPPVPGAAGVAVLDPQVVQGGAQRVIVVLDGTEEGPVVTVRH